MKLKEAAQMGDCYTTVTRRQYRIIPCHDWGLSPEDPDNLYCSYCVQPVSSKGLQERLIRFSFGCGRFFGGAAYINKADQIPKELATLTIEWFLEEAGDPPVRPSYDVVFTRTGLRHREGGPEDPEFGEGICPTLADVVEQLKRRVLKASERGRQIGFHPRRSEFWTHKSEIAQSV